jgi:hypothetical protein
MTSTPRTHGDNANSPDDPHGAPYLPLPNSPPPPPPRPVPEAPLQLRLDEIFLPRRIADDDAAAVEAQREGDAQAQQLRAEADDAPGLPN